MQDRTYSDLLFLIQSLIGAGNLTSEEQGSIDSFINRRAHEAFQTSQSWPRFLVSSEERNIIAYVLSGATSSTITDVNANYKFIGLNDGDIGKAGTKVYEDSNPSAPVILIYKNSSNAWIVTYDAGFSINADGTVDITSAGTTQFTEADSVKKDRVEDVETWTPRAGSDVLSVSAKNLIPYTQTNKNNIGEFLKIHRKKAYLNNSSIEYDFFVDSDGGNILNITNTTDNAAFITYKKELPQYTITSTDIPGEWFFFIAHASYADFLRIEGEVEKALVEEERGQKYLALELEKIDNMSNNNVFNRFSTHGTRQSR
tara:strand:+ start:344 stop:1285 length:942 start_codon:yes stop_codon:yes gene_type:complete